MRRLAIDPEQPDFLRIQFRYDPELLAVVRGLPGRRFASASKTWLVPRRHADLVWQVLRPHGFTADTEVMALIAGLEGDGLLPLEDPVDPALDTDRFVSANDDGEPDDGARAMSAAPSTAAKLARAQVDGEVVASHLPAPAAPAAAPRALSVGQLNEMARVALRAAFPGELWVTGELVGWDRRSRSRHVYFELVEKHEQRDEVTARVSAVLWSRDRGHIEQRLRSADEPFQLADGLVVRVKVAVDLYTVRGQFQVAVRDIDPVFTLGNLALRREAILRSLAASGLLERNRALALPLAPLRIALLTSADGEARSDFLHELGRPGLGFDVELFPVRVQGPRLAPTVLTALARVAHRHEARAYDVVVIVRGGGSRTDLAWFDHQEVAEAVARLPIKVVVGIGHQRDQSVLDVVAHSAKTPTAAATLLVEQVVATLAWQSEVWLWIRERVRSATLQANDELDETARRLTRGFSRCLTRRRQTLDDLSARVGPRARAVVTRLDERLDHAVARLRERSQIQLRLARRDNDGARQALSRGRLRARVRQERLRVDGLLDALDRSAAAVLERRRAEVDRAALQTRLLDPRRILERGFARVRTEDGRIATDASVLAHGDRLRIEMRDGDLEVTVEDIDLPDASGERDEPNAHLDPTGDPTT